MPMRIRLYPGHASLASEHAGYLDFFSDDHRNREPVILCNCTSVKWLAGWTPKHAREWQLQRRLTNSRLARGT